MENCRIYLSGAMSNVSFEEQSQWRKEFVDYIKYYCDYWGYKKPSVFNPVKYYNLKEKQYKTEKEVMEFDLYNLRHSDLIVVNLNNSTSIGTAMELMLAKELKIPVIAFNVNEQTVHPWLLECCSRICNDLDETIKYVSDFYLS